MLSSSCHTSEADRHFMMVALAVGYRNLGRTWPNPSVGAVLVADTPDGPKILSEGVTAAGGRPHAERMAIDSAGPAARGSTLYVTLEPCSHRGRAMPCADAIIAAGIRRVVAGILDPDERVAGHGFARMRDAGIAVISGVLADEARRLHRGHLKRVSAKRPFVTVKMARTKDGYAGSGTHERLMITGEAANARTHMIRARSDAVLIGISTANADDPGLDVRLPGMEGRSPVRVVFDSALSINPELRLVKTACRMPTWIVAAEDADEGKAEQLREAGIDVMRVGYGADGRLDPAEAMHRLYDRGLSTVLCEGGPTLAQAIAGLDLADEIILVTGAEDFGAKGLLALSPQMERILERRFRLECTEWAGRDEFAFYGKVK